MMLGFTFKYFCETYKGHSLWDKGIACHWCQLCGRCSHIASSDTHQIVFIKFHYIYLVSQFGGALVHYRTPVQVKGQLVGARCFLLPCQGSTQMARLGSKPCYPTEPPPRLPFTFSVIFFILKNGRGELSLLVQNQAEAGELQVTQ